MRKTVLLITALALLLGGCAQLSQNYQAAKTQTHEESEELSPSLSGLAASPGLLADPEEKMVFGSDDMDKALSFWPFKECGIDYFGKPEYISLFTYGKYLYVMFQIDTGKDFSSVQNEMDLYFKGEWGKDSDGVDVFTGNSEGRHIECSVLEFNSLCTLIMVITIYDEYRDAVKLMDDHWPLNDIVMPETLGSPSERNLELESSGVTIKYTWDITDYADVFEWYCGVMEKYGRKRPADAGKDLAAAINVGSVFVIIGVLQDSKTVSISCQSSEGVEF